MTTRRNARKGFATRAIHHGYDPKDALGALNPPIYMTSTYAVESAEQGGEILRGERDGYFYGRTRNPTQAILEKRLADLEGAEAGVVFGSGMGAISATFWSFLAAGDAIVADRVLYGNTFALIEKGVSRFGIEPRFVDMTDPDKAAAAFDGRTRLVYFETPANPNLRVIDIAAIARHAHAAGALVVVDNTFATPVLQRPLEHGADLVVHSATKFLGGHGDLLAGAVLGSAERVKQVRMHGLRYMTGATLSPMNAFLVLRGLKTLDLRVRHHSKSALEIARNLQRHRAVARVDYPGLPGTAGEALARRQMPDGGGGLLSFELKGGMAAGLRMINSVKLVLRAVSLGDAETLIQHPASMTHATYDAAARAAHGISDGLVRLSVGLENVEDIWDDLEAALEGLG